MNILEYTLEGLTRYFELEHNKGNFHARALFREVFKKGNPDFFSAPEFRASPRLSAALAGRIKTDPGKVVRVFEEENLTKFITRLSDGLEIESVIIPMTRYQTLCVSSQVGCRMGCRFCETGQMGFRRSLLVSEITGQLYNGRHTLGKNIKNVVFMGMGEPFDNFDAVMKAVLVMNEQKGFDVALSHITISTAGLVPGINRLARMNLPNLRLAVSVNAADDKIRSGIMPVNRTYPLKALKKALKDFPLSGRGTFLLEYILIRGVNDSLGHAQKLSEFIGALPVRLNLIPFNPVSGFEAHPSCDEDMHRFAAYLGERGIFVIKRWSKGRSVSAGCGQLGKTMDQD